MTKLATEFSMPATELPASLLGFLPCETPDSWVNAAERNMETLLIDHANCEKKAAATAMNLMYRYTECAELLQKMSQLAREELLHFQQVTEIIRQRSIRYIKLSPSRYASGLRKLIRHQDQEGLVDTLIIGALIEARSCERFMKLVNSWQASGREPALQRFYRGLIKSEARHYEDYLSLAQRYAVEEIDNRIEKFRDKEQELVLSPDSQFRFHSGVPS